MRGANPYGKHPSDYLQHHPFYSMSESFNRGGSYHNRSIQQPMQSLPTPVKGYIQPPMTGGSSRKPIASSEQFSSSPYNLTPQTRPPTYSQPYSAMFNLRTDQQSTPQIFPSSNKSSSNYSFIEQQQLVTQKRQIASHSYQNSLANQSTRVLSNNINTLPLSPAINGKSYHHENSLSMTNGALPKLDQSNVNHSSHQSSSQPYLINQMGPPQSSMQNNTSIAARNHKVLNINSGEKKNEVGPRSHLLNIVKYSKQNSGELHSMENDYTEKKQPNGNSSSSSSGSSIGSSRLLFQRPPSNSNNSISSKEQLNSQMSKQQSSQTISKSISYSGQSLIAGKSGATPTAAYGSNTDSNAAKSVRRNSNQTQFASNSSLSQLNSFSSQSAAALAVNTSIPAASKNPSVSIAYAPVQQQQQYADLLDPRMIPKIDKSKISTKAIGLVQAYAANTHQGLVRQYNEDRVSIILNMVKPQEKANVMNWPNVSYFAIYDGHGGANCADFMRDNLHHFILKDKEFPGNPSKAISNGFAKAEEIFIENADSTPVLDKSGSCAIVVMLVSKGKSLLLFKKQRDFFLKDEIAYIANLGDSRAVLSEDRGRKITGLTVDHKPNSPGEERRILENGGKIYQSQVPTMQPKHLPQYIRGPHRVHPGRLAVSRTFGDAEAKLVKYGGNPRVVSSEPEVTSFKLSPAHDFIMLGCDGIFDKLSNSEAGEALWNSLRLTTSSNVHECIGDSVEALMRQTFLKKSFDNLTIVMVCLKTIDKL